MTSSRLKERAGFSSDPQRYLIKEMRTSRIFGYPGRQKRSRVVDVRKVHYLSIRISQLRQMVFAEVVVRDGMILFALRKY